MIKIKNYNITARENQYDLQYKLKNNRTNNENTSQEEISNIRSKEQVGQVVPSSIFIDLIKQLYLEKATKKELTLHINVVETLWAHLGNGYFFDVKGKDWNKLYEYAIDLFYVNPFLNSSIAENLAHLIGSVKYLRNKGITFEILEGK